MENLISSQQVEQQTQYAMDNGYRLSFRSLLLEARNLLNPNYGLLIGSMFVFFVVSIILSFVPFLNLIVALVSNGFLFGGFFWICFLTEQRQEVSVKRFFEVKSRIADLLVLALIQFISYIVCFIPVILFLGAELWELWSEQLRTGQPNIRSIELLIRNPLLYVSYLIMMIGALSIYVFYSLSYGYVVIGKISALQAIKNSIMVVKINIKDHFVVHLSFWGLTFLGLVATALIGTIFIYLGIGFLFGIIFFVIYIVLLFYVLPLYLVFQYRIFSKILNLDQTLEDDIDSIGMD